MWDILTPDGWVKGQIDTDDNGRIARITPAVGRSQGVIIPGFIDLHVHGAGGKDIMLGGDTVSVLSQTHAQHGTTSLLATMMIASAESLAGALKAIDVSMQAPPDARAGCTS